MKKSEFIVQARACGILFRNSQLLIHRKVGDTIWALPGGRVEPDESSIDAVVRELYEELGCSFSVERLVRVIENNFTHNGRCYFEIGFYFLVRTDSQRIWASAKQFFGVDKRLEFKWVDRSEFSRVDFRPLVSGISWFDLPHALQHLSV
jgi:8-oxo-dGTP pyrophosphatase MutT (NUDIX family)